MMRPRSVLAAAPLLLLAGIRAQAVATPPAAAPSAGAPPGLELIDRGELLEHATYLAADERGGRLTGSEGQIAAANYIAAHFAKLGLEPLGDAAKNGERSYLQRYPVARTYLDMARTELLLGGAPLQGGFAVLPPADVSEAEVAITGDWVLFSARDEQAKLEGRVPVVRLETPRLRSDNVYARFGSAMKTFLRSRGIAGKAAAAGAKGIVFCLLDDDTGVADTLNMVALQPGKHLLSFAEDGGMAEGMAHWKASIPQVFLSSAVSRQVLAALGDSDLPEPGAAARAAPGVLRLAIATDADAHAVNVVACLRGADETLAAEAVVYSAHMDHIGLRFDGEVFNGADDNASGTAGLMEIAQAFAGAEPRPRRSIVFLAVSGEELGLWGSRYFSEHPTWPQNDIVADVNTDMIGRSGPESAADEVTVTPSHRHEMFSSIVRDAAEIAATMGVAFVGGDKYYERSDHINFARLGIPVVFFCSGEHEDYHQVTDHADKLDGDKMERIARIAYLTGRKVADADGRPALLGRSDGWTGGPR